MSDSAGWSDNGGAAADRVATNGGDHALATNGDYYALDGGKTNGAGTG